MEFIEINKYAIHSVKLIDSNEIIHIFTTTGCYDTHKDAECLLFPSKDQRDWNVWKEEQDKNQLKTFKEGAYGITSNKTIYRIDSIIDSHYVNAMHLDNGRNYSYLLIIWLKLINPIESFKPFDKVLVRNTKRDCWITALFSHIDNNKQYNYFTSYINFKYCIPYNIETKHLVGTTQKAPEFYINW